MWYYRQAYQYELYHHGILGQKWGKRNGPPYPLDASDHSASERKAGWKKSLHKVEKKTEKHYNNAQEPDSADRKKSRLSDKQKRAIKIGAAVTVAALATYGTYRLAKSGKLDNLINLGKKQTESFLGENLAGDVPKGIARKLSNPETLSDTFSKVNPLRGTDAGHNNCVPCAVAGFIRQAGYDVTAKSTGGAMQNPGGVVEECFKGAKILDGSAQKFGKSRKDAAELLVHRFGDNAEGLCSIHWKGTDIGHCFSWKIKDRKVLFFDCQQGTKGVSIDHYFNMIDRDGPLTIARLDGAEIDWDAAKKYIKF